MHVLNLIAGGMPASLEFYRHRSPCQADAGGPIRERWVQTATIGGEVSMVKPTDPEDVLATIQRSIEVSPKGLR